MTKKHNLAELKAFGKTHAALPEIVNQLQTRQTSRRDFLAHSTALGMSAATAYGLAGVAVPRARNRRAGAGLCASG